MRQKITVSMFLITALIVVTLPYVQGGVFDPFHTKEEKTLMWKDLWNDHSNTEYFSVGKRYDGSEILLFAAGNQNGGRVLWDAEMHGNEDKGSEILFLIAQWLLESNDTQAKTILEHNYVMFIPIVNNQASRGNGYTAISQFGVDLNRNFETGWRQSLPTSDIYSGQNALSEPETRAMRNIFSSYKPTFYVNLHCGAGPYAAFYNASNVYLSEMVKTTATQLCEDWGIIPYQTISMGSNGYAIGDAAQLGVQSTWIIETVGESTAWRHLSENYLELVDTYFPKCRAIFIAMCELSSPTDQTAKVVFINQNPAPNMVYPQNSVMVQSSITPCTNGIKNVTLEYTSNNLGTTRVNMVKTSSSVWTGAIPSFPLSTSITYSIIVEDNAGTITSSLTTGVTPSYIVSNEPQAPSPYPTKTAKPSSSPTSSPIQTNTPTAPANDPTPSSTQDPNPTQKVDNGMVFQPIYLTIAAITVAIMTLATFLIKRKENKTCKSLNTQ